MRRADLARIVRYASEVTGREAVLILGSQSILGTYPQSALPRAATLSREADVAFFDDEDNDLSDRVEWSMGEGGRFDARHGYYAQGVNVEVATLPDGWRERTITWRPDEGRPGYGVCLDPHDLAVAKLAAYRDKDFTFVAALLDAGLIQASTIIERARLIPGRPEVVERVVRWTVAYSAASTRPTRL